MAKRSFLVALALALSALAAPSCVGGFDPQSKLTSVRILATRADKPYAAPGDTVNIEMTAYDGRADRSRPMRLTWLPFLCVNPINDAYFGCFAQLAGRSPSGGQTGIPAIKPGTDLTPFLPSGPRYSVTLPKDIIDKHEVVPGAAERYGLGIVFNIACAGQVRLVEFDPNNDNPQQVPIGCFDDDGNRLGPDDFVFGFTRVYAYDTLRNANPVITRLTYKGEPVDPAKGITVQHCDEQDKEKCPSIDVEVPVDSQETTADKDPDGASRREQIWVTYYATAGEFTSDARLLFDVRTGKVPGSENHFLPVREASEGRLWAVVRDNRGGAAWIDVPVFTQAAPAN